MTAFITKNCIICGTCWDLCPKHAVVESEDCDDCGKCIEACPNFAIAKTIAIGARLDAHIDERMAAPADGDG
jgi:formate hydrogenlyase subunit 6/NADH:ubiquinone oxidoreductase subunit I